MSGIRYSRQVTLAGWGDSGQARLAGARVFLVGAGGLGVPAATYLVTSGIGTLVVNDFDDVDESNLPRQPLYRPNDVGRAKAAVVADRLKALNPDCRIETVDSRLSEDGLQEHFDPADVVLDCSDNFATRFGVNRACVATRTPLVSGAAIRFEAQLAVFRPDLDGPCYRCLYDERGEDLEDCAGQGVIAPLVGLVGCAMALETLKILVGLGTGEYDRLRVFDALAQSWRTFTFRRDPQCPVCRLAQSAREQ